MTAHYVDHTHGKSKKWYTVSRAFIATMEDKTEMAKFIHKGDACLYADEKRLLFTGKNVLIVH